MGSQKNSSAGSTPVEAPNSLLSISRVKILDMVAEGTISGFARKSGIFGNDPLVSTYYDDIPVRNLDGSYNFNVSGQGYSFSHTLGTPNQSAITNFERVENLIPLSSNTRLANPPINGGEYKTVNASINTNIYPDADSIRITIRVPALFTTDNNGNTNGYEMKYAIDVALNNGPFVQQDEVTIRGKCTSAYLKSTSYLLPKTTPASSFYEWKIRVRRTTQNILSSRTANELFVDSISVISSSQYSYPNTALVGTEISFDQFSSLPTRAYEIEGLLVSVPAGYTPTTYNNNGTITVASYPTVWNGTFAASKRWTDNPAWVFYDLITNKRYGLGNYIQADLIDKWTLYEIAQYCDALVSDGEGGLEPRFTCNVIIQERQDAYQLLLNLVSVFRGMMYWGNGRIFATQTDDKSPIFNFTNANVIGGNFNYADSAGNVRSTVALVKFTDPSNLYRDATIYIEDREGIVRYGYVTKEVTAFACTSKGQAYRVGNWILTTERLLTETVSFQAGLEGIYIRPGDVFNVYDNFRNNVQQGGRVIDINAARTSLTLDRPVNLEIGNTYSLTAVIPKFNFESTGELTGSNQIQFIRNSQVEPRQVTTPAGSGQTFITVSNAYSTGLYPGSIWILSASGTNGNVFQRSSPYKCISAGEAQPGVIEILGLQYNTGINGITEGSYTVISNPVNSGDNSPIDPATNLVIQPVTGLLSDNSFFSYLALSWSGTASTNLSSYRVSGQRFGGSWSNFANTPTTGVNFNTSVTGQHNFKVIAVSQGGIFSSELSNSYTVSSANPLGNPPNLSGLQISANFDEGYNSISGYTGYYETTPTFTWTIPTDGSNDVAQAQFISGYNFRLLRHTDNVNLLVSPISLAGLTNTSFRLPKNLLITGMVGGAQRLFKAYVEVVDIYGNTRSGASLVVNNTAPSPPIGSGFTPIFGGLNYTVNPQALDTDISGIFLWYNTGSSFVPQFSNANFTSANLAGFSSNNLTGAYFVWYALGDTFGFTGSQIYGPVSVQTTAALTGFRSNNNPFLGDSVTLRSTGNGLSLVQNGNDIFISGDFLNIVFTTGNQLINGNKAFGGNTSFGGTSHFTGNVGFYGVSPATRDTYTDNYNTRSYTLNNYVPNSQGAYAGIDSGQAGTPYAQVSDLNALRSAYENLRASYDNSIQIISAMISGDKRIGLKA